MRQKGHKKWEGVENDDRTAGGGQLDAEVQEAELCYEDQRKEDQRFVKPSREPPGSARDQAEKQQADQGNQESARKRP